MSLSPTNPFVEFPAAEIHGSISRRFEKQVRLHRKRIAVKLGHGSVTYDQLNRAANGLARAIVARRGTKPEPVALLMEPGLDLITAMLGVLKAGKFWVPIDPSYPQARITYLLEDSEAALLCVDSTGLPRVPQPRSIGDKVLRVDQPGVELSDQNLDTAASADDFAFVLYTSGSTGKPKGVIHSHRQVLEIVRWHTQSRHLCPDDRLSLLSPLVHSSGATDILRALLNGARLLPFHLKEEGLNHLPEWLKKEEITIYHSTPSVFRNFVDTLRPGEAFPRLRLVVLGGEAVTRRDVELYKEHFSPPCLLLNHLGATEVGTYGEYYVNHKATISQNVVPVRCGVENKRVFLLDEGGHEVGREEVGEIAVQGSYLSPGYWRDADMTARAFRSIGDQNERTYLTGDLGQRTPDGLLLHMGRKDSQVKIRGFRIELGEIEAVLAEHPQIKASAAIVLEDDSGVKRLIAHVVPEQGVSAPDRDEMTEFLRRRLPDYMVPFRFVPLGALPLSPNGKIDRKALSATELETREPRDGFEAPQTVMEGLLAEMWREVLDVEPVGALDSFFDLGGDSLQSMRVIARLESKTGVRLRTRDMTSQTLRQVALTCEQKLGRMMGLETSRDERVAGR